MFEGTTSLERQKRAEREAAERGLTIVPPFDHLMIIAGQGTVGLEILDQCPDVAVVFVEVGGGGLSSGLAAAIKQRKPSVRVIGVEPEGAAKMSRSLAAGHPVTLEKSSSIADGLMSSRPGDLTFAHVKKFVDEVVVVPDAEIIKAVAWLFRNARLVVEPSGAITTAAIMLGLGGVDAAAGPVVAVVSGGNVAPRRSSRFSQREGSTSARSSAPIGGHRAGTHEVSEGSFRNSRELTELRGFRHSASRLPTAVADVDSGRAQTTPSRDSIDLPLRRLVEVRDLAIELQFVHSFQNLADARPRLQSHCEQVPALHDRFGRSMFDAKGTRFLDKPVHRRAVEPPAAAVAVGAQRCARAARDRPSGEPPERSIADLVAHLVERAGLQVVRDHPEHLRSARRSRRASARSTDPTTALTVPRRPPRGRAIESGHR